MAKRRPSTAVQVYRSPPVRVAAPAPIVIRQSAPLQRPKRRGRRRSGGGSLFGGGGGGPSPITLGLTAGVIGLAEGQGLLAKLPAVPMVGRKGALAIGAWYWGKHGGGQLARDIALVAAVLSGYELAKTGTISGEDE